MTTDAPHHALLIISLLLLPVPAWATEWNPLADSGQLICYDIQGSEIVCPTAENPFYGQDAQYRGAQPAYRTNNNQTVTDLNSGLIWTESDVGIQHTWQNAIAYCEELSHAGKSDWRLPGKFELESIVDYGRFDPAVDPLFSCHNSFYWSATPHMGNPAYAWSVYCLDGADHWVHKSNNYYVRCVRVER